MTPISTYMGNSQTYQPRMEIPVNGMKRALSQANEASIRIADGDLNPRSFVELMGAQYSFEANAKVLKVMDETVGTLLNTVA